MQKPVTEVTDLTHKEKELLETIYGLRYKDLFWAGSFRFLVGCTIYLFVLFFFLCFFHDIIFITERWLSQPFWMSHLLTLFAISFICTLIIIPLAYYYWILPFKKDALSGKKIVKAYTVTSKEFYPVTEQYFITLTDGTGKHHEVTEKVYNSCEENDQVYLNTAIESGYVLDQVGYFKINLFEISRGGRFDYRV